MAYSCEGYNGMSQCMHAFVREHIVRGAFKHKVRPGAVKQLGGSLF